MTASLSVCLPKAVQRNLAEAEAVSIGDEAGFGSAFEAVKSCALLR